MEIDYSDVATWDLIQAGRTKGVFQCESPLVQSWLKKIKPTNIWELSAVIAIVRPGPLQSGFADDYVEYRNGTKLFESFGHPTIDDIFSITDHVMLYQEQIMNLGARLAWPDLEEKERLKKVDGLRKAVGKKNQAKLLAVGKEFVEGCGRNKVEEELSEKLFEIIKNCGRYVFNLSHSIAYSHVAYKTAYMKTHYPLQFYSTYLTYSKFKMKSRDEIYALVQDARKAGTPILTPNINKHNEHFRIEGQNVRYGLGHIKYFGTKTIDKVRNLPEINSWKQVILLCCTEIFGFKFNIRTSESLIKSGCFSDIKMGRNTLWSIVQSMNSLTGRESEWIIEKLDSLEKPEDLKACFYECAEVICNKTRRPKVESIAELMTFGNDNPAWIEKQEHKLLGCALTCTAIDNKFTSATSRCEDCDDSVPLWQTREVAVIIEKVIFTETKKGKNPGQKMARIFVYDSTGRIDNLPVFPDAFLAVEDLLIENNTVVVTIKKGRNGWILEEMEQV